MASTASPAPALTTVSPFDPARDDAVVISELINTAFIEGDSWYKKEGSQWRLSKDGKDLEKLLADKTHAVLVARGATKTPEGACVVIMPEGSTSTTFTMLSVPKRHGGQGHGRALVRAAEAVARKAGRRKIEATIVTSRNERLLTFYDRLGFDMSAADKPCYWTYVILPELHGKVFCRQISKSLPVRAADDTIPREELCPGYTCSRVILGGWQLSAGHSAAAGSEEELYQLQRRHAAHGINHFDMGDIYTGVEERVGRFLLRADSSVASKVRIHTKLVPDLSALASRVDRTYVRGVLSRSLARLRGQRSKLDLVQLHWWQYQQGDGGVGAIRELAAAQKDGLVAHVGVTNFSAERLEPLLRAAPGVVVSAQVQYSLLDRRVATGALTRLCTEHGIKFVCYGVLAGGFLTDTWLGKPEPQKPYENRSLSKYKLIIDDFGGWDVFQALLRTLRGVADKYEWSVASRDAAAAEGKATTTAATTQQQQQKKTTTTTASIAMVAIAWTLLQPRVAAAILGARHERHLRSSIAAANLAARLRPEDLAAIAAAVENRGPQGAFYDLERDKTGRHGAVMKYELNRVHTAHHFQELRRRVGEWRASTGKVEAGRRRAWAGALLAELRTFKFEPALFVPVESDATGCAVLPAASAGDSEAAAAGALAAAAARAEAAGVEEELRLAAIVC